uniref:Uncharacterized protein n=1 Tax=Anguilla anguilla TaxID=7936 RepID=A0A0E9PT60_ANGAN
MLTFCKVRAEANQHTIFLSIKAAVSGTGIPQRCQLLQRSPENSIHEEQR